MIELDAAELLFEKNKVYRISSEPLKISEKTSKRAVFLYESRQEVLAPSAQTMLEKMAKACKFSENEVVYLFAGKHPDISIGKIQQAYAPELVLVFGNIAISRNAQPLTKHHPYEFNGVKVVLTDTPEKLEANSREKTALWKVLQTLLQIQA